MYENNQPKAVVIKTYTSGSLELRLTEKGAVVMYRNTDTGPRFVCSLRPSDVKAHAELNSPLFVEITQSQEWAAIQDGKEKAKAEKYIQSRAQQEIIRAAKMVQAAKDKLTALGLDPEAVFKKQA